MIISFRRTGGVVTLLAFAAVALVATLVTVVVAAAVLVVLVAAGAALLLLRAVRPAAWRLRTRPGSSHVAVDTIEGTVVRSTDAPGALPPGEHHAGWMR